MVPPLDRWHDVSVLHQDCPHHLQIFVRKCKFLSLSCWSPLHASVTSLYMVTLLPCADVTLTWQPLKSNQFSVTKHKKAVRAMPGESGLPGVLSDKHLLLEGNVLKKKKKFSLYYTHIHIFTYHTYTHTTHTHTSHIHNIYTHIHLPYIHTHHTYTHITHSHTYIHIHTRHT